MKTIIFLTVLITLTLGQRLAPPRNPPNQPEQGKKRFINFYPLQAGAQLIVESTCLFPLLLIKYIFFYIFQVRDVQEETLMEEDVVHQRIHVTMERETVMDLLMVELMMVMLDAREILCVAATIVRSLVTTIMRRMTAAIFQRLFRTHLLNHKLLLMLL